jgi:hemoglobin
MSPSADERSVFDICGRDFFVSLVDAFYNGVEMDPVLMSMYPDGADTTEARHRLSLFFIQYWGGPHDYMEQRGHPMLRMRHGPFPIDAHARDRWLSHMASAIEQTMHLVPEAERESVVQQLATYVVNAAEHLRNQ